jgi:hypothetical protein
LESGSGRGRLAVHSGKPGINASAAYATIGAFVADAFIPSKLKAAEASVTSLSSNYQSPAETGAEISCRDGIVGRTTERNKATLRTKAKVSVAVRENRSNNPKADSSVAWSQNILSLIVAHPTRFERVTFAFGAR